MRPKPKPKPQPTQQTEFPEISHIKKRAFLTAYSAIGTITDAAKSVVGEEGKHENLMRDHYHWIARDPKYAAAFRRAQELSCVALEEEARLRAVTGWLEPVFHQGKVAGSIRKKSDTLLIFLMKGNNKQKFSDRQEFSGPDGGPIQTRNVDAERDELARLLDGLAARTETPGDTESDTTG